MNFQNYLFDLDGTLTDPGLGIKNSIRYALRSFGLEELSETTLDQFIGPPLLDSFCRYCHVSDEDSRRLLTLYREYFSVTGLFENTVYEGVMELLAELKDRGAKIFLATSKPEPYARQILEHFSLAPFFDFVGGSTMDETRTAKDEVIAYVMEQAGIGAFGSVMVGDRTYDVAGGKACGLFTVGALYGYGSREELKDADFLIERPAELLLL